MTRAERFEKLRPEHGVIEATRIATGEDLHAKIDDATATVFDSVRDALFAEVLHELVEAVFKVKNL